MKTPSPPSLPEPLDAKAIAVDKPPSPAPRPEPTPGSGAGLRLRIWIGCLGSALVVAAALWVIVTRQPRVTGTAQAELYWVWLPAIGGGGILLGMLLALWLDRGIVRALRGLSRSIAAGQVAALRGLPSTSGWGELSDLAMQLQKLLARQRQLSRSVVDLEQLHQQIEHLRDSLERWTASGRWQPLEPEIGPLLPIATLLERAFAGGEERREQARAAADVARSERAASMVDAREAAAQSERAFVEATALLTTVRELQRLGGELRQAVKAGPGERASVESEALQRHRAAAATAIEELVSASTDSVGHLAASIGRVAEISDAVQLIANRATLIALNAVAAARSAEPRTPIEREVTDELKTLSREVRSATDHTAHLARDIGADVAAARERMNGVRARVAEALDRAPDVAPEDASASAADLARLEGRVREMIQDATLKGERLSAAGEKASRAAEGLMRRLEQETQGLEDLVAALSGKGEAPAATTRAAAPPAALTSIEESRPGGSPPRELRLLGREDPEGGAGGASGRAERR